MSKITLLCKDGFMQHIRTGSFSVYRTIFEKRSPAGEQQYKSKQVAFVDSSSHQKYAGYISCGTTHHEGESSNNNYVADTSDSLESILAQAQFAPKILRGSPAKTLYRKLARQFQEQLDKRTH